MERQFLDTLKGYVKIRITGNSYDRFLNLCAFHGIRLWDLQPEGESYTAFVDRGDFKKLKTIVRKSHASVRITERRGLPFFIHRYRKRKVYIAGIAAAFLLMAWLSAHIWNIRVDGNLSQTDDAVFEYLQNSGVRHGMRKSGVDCRELAARIRNYFTQFAWVSVELKGTRLLIHVKEGINGTEDSAAALPEDAQPSGLEAARDGTVVSIYVRSGLPQVKAGDEVRKGDLLVSGAIPVFDDGGGILSYQYVAADADIVIRSEQRYYDAVPFSHLQKYRTGRERHAWMVRIGELPLALPDRFDALGQYDVTGSLTQLQLGENFYLPVYLEKYTAREYEYVEVTRTRDEITRILQEDFQYFIKNLKEKGVQLFENDVRIEWNEKSAIASGTLVTGSGDVRRVAVDDAREELSDDEYG